MYTVVRKAMDKYQETFWCGRSLYSSQMSAFKLNRCKDRLYLPCLCVQLHTIFRCQPALFCFNVVHSCVCVFNIQEKRGERMVEVSTGWRGQLHVKTKNDHQAPKQTSRQACILPRSSKHKLRRYLSMLIPRNLRIRPSAIRSCLRYRSIVDVPIRIMTTERSKLPHEDRTAKEPRTGELHPVILDQIDTVNDTIRLFRLEVKHKERGVKVRFPLFNSFLKLAFEDKICKSCLCVSSILSMFHYLSSIILIYSSSRIFRYPSHSKSSPTSTKNT
jgi:hypothetical protein